jgi:hypothetical protein
MFYEIANKLLTLSMLLSRHVALTVAICTWTNISPSCDAVGGYVIAFYHLILKPRVTRSYGTRPKGSF